MTQPGRRREFRLPKSQIRMMRLSDKEENALDPINIGDEVRVEMPEWLATKRDMTY